MVLPRGGSPLQLAPDGWTQHLCAHFLGLSSRGKASNPWDLGRLIRTMVLSDIPTLRQLWGAGEEIPISFTFLSTPLAFQHLECCHPLYHNCGTSCACLHPHPHFSAPPLSLCIQHFSWPCSYFPHQISDMEGYPKQTKSQ